MWTSLRVPKLKLNKHLFRINQVKDYFKKINDSWSNLNLTVIFPKRLYIKTRDKESLGDLIPFSIISHHLFFQQFWESIFQKEKQSCTEPNIPYRWSLTFRSYRLLACWKELEENETKTRKCFESWSRGTW